MCSIRRMRLRARNASPTCSGLLRSPHWAAGDLVTYLWWQADARLEALESAGEEPLGVWDTSVLEKPESLASPDLGAVRSRKAHRLTRLTRLKPGFYHPPSRPLLVPGWQWLGLLLLGRRGQSGPPTVAHLRLAPLVEHAWSACERSPHRGG